MAVIATVRKDGRPQCVPNWYEYSDGHLLPNMTTGCVRLSHMKANPNVAMSIMWHKQWYRHLSIIGHVVEIYEDVAMQDLDRISMRCIGLPHKTRGQQRVNARVAINAWLGWDATTFATSGVAKASNQFGQG